MAVTNPEDFPQIFGRDFVKRNGQNIIELGGRTYTKYKLGQIGCPHTNAARELARAFKELHVDRLEEVPLRYSPEDFVKLPNFGITAFYALTCLLRDARLDVKQFYKKKITVTTLQLHARSEDGKRTKKLRRTA